MSKIFEIELDWDTIKWALRYEDFHFAFGYGGNPGIYATYYDGPILTFNLFFFYFGWWCSGFSCPCHICKLTGRPEKNKKRYEERKAAGEFDHH